MLLVIYVLLGICITLSVYLVLDSLLEWREVGGLKPQLRQGHSLATACRRLWRRGVRKANGVIPKRAPRR